jgi:signal transduction histidine kinase
MRLNKELTRKTDELEKARFEHEIVNSRLKEQDELKDDFLTTVTHELRTPITSIRAFSEILFDNEDLEVEERKQYLGIIIKETERISRLISQVLDLEKYDSGKQKLITQKVDLKSLVEQSAISINQLLREKNIVIIKDFKPCVHDVFIDEDKIQQVLINLLSNAIKFTKDEIVLKLRFTDTHWLLYVEDNGAGIPEELRDLIFEKFYQAKNQTIRKPKGSGLGLAISKRIMELHQGNLVLIDKPKSGAVFLLEVPYNPLNLPS